MIRYLYLVYIIGIYIVCNLQIFYYVYQSLKLFHRHKNYIASRFSYTENISLGWIKALIFCFVAFFVVNQFLYIFGVKQHEAARIFYNVSVLGVILFAGYHGLMQKDLGLEEDQEEGMQIMQGMQTMQTMQGEVKRSEDFLAEGLSKSKYSGSSLASAQKEALIERIEVLMREEKIFTQLELSIEEVAHRLGTNSKYISQILNEHYRKNFFTFINTLRVEEAQRLLTAGNARKYSIIGIARMAGFSSKSSFNEAFRRIVGMTPSKYLEKSSEISR
jgi:AraC-like DNA-binding protein